MSLSITSLNSGSNGNCYYVGNENEAILIDAGISCREVERRLRRLDLKIEKVKAVFVSHEHSDHIKGLSVLIKKYQLPVYITQKTMRSGRLSFENQLVKKFTAYKSILIGGLSVTPFPKFHDAIDPYSFVVSCNDICVGIFTDIGTPCLQVKNYFQKCHAAFLEANYDEKMLENGLYPVYLKNRIRGGMGHLSNQQALELFVSCRPKFMSHLIISHLSKHNNSHRLVEQLFASHAGDVKITVASRYRETEILQIGKRSADKDIPVITHKKQSSWQLSFSFA